MEYINLANWYQWTGNNPAIFFSIDYKYYRKGADMVYKFKVTLHPLSYPSYYGYWIYLSIILNGVTQVNAHIIKSNGSQWNELVYETEEFTVSNVISGTVPVSFNIFDENWVRNVTWSFSLEVSEAGICYINNEPYQCYIGDGTNWNLYIPYIGDGTNWNEYGI